MADPVDMILPMLREMHAEMNTRFGGVDRRFDTVDRRLEKLEAGYRSMHQVTTADTLVGKHQTGECEQRIEALEEKVERLEGQNK